MKAQLKIFHYTLAVIILVACGLIFISYGWIFYATLTERPGMNGDMYHYYQTDRMIFALYNLIIAFGSMLTILRLTFFVYKKERVNVTRVFIQFGIFLAILILCEIYFNSRFVSKG